MGIDGLMESGRQGAQLLLDGVFILLAFLSGALAAARLHSVRARPAPGHALPTVRSIGAPEPVSRPLLDSASVSPARAQAFGHEMKNYLCAIKGSAKLLRLGPQGKEQVDILDRIDRVVECLETFALGDITAAPSVAPDVLSTRARETLDLASMARASVRLHFAQSSADFPCHAAEPMPPVQGDPQRLDQVFRNLYGNALEAGAATVSTRFRRLGGELEITIEDDGHGCPEEIAGRIFDPFFSTKTAAGSTTGVGESARGLGLFIVQTIVENHGGQIRARSKNGRGGGEHGLIISINLPVFSSAGAASQVPPTRLAQVGATPPAFAFRSAA